MVQQANHDDDCKVCTCMVVWVALLYEVVAKGALKLDKKIVYFWLLFPDQPKDLLSSACCCLFVFACDCVCVFFFTEVPICTTT